MEAKMMRLRIVWVFALLGITAFGQGTVSMAGSAMATAPAQAPFQALGSWRLEVRISDFDVVPGEHQTIFNVNRMALRILRGSNNLGLTSFYDKDSPTIETSIAGRRDIVVRIQRNNQTKRFQMEIWDANGSNYLAAPEQENDGRNEDYSGDLAVGQNVFGGERFPGKIAYLRWYSDLVPEHSPPPNNLGGGNLLQLEFENSLNDAARRVAWKPGKFAPAYGATAPMAVLPEPYTIRAGFPHQLDGRPSGATRYKWEQVKGPSDLEFDNPASPTPTITGAIFGSPSYVLKLTVTDVAGKSAENTVKIGAVPTNENGVVIVEDGKASFILGPMLRDGLSPWPFYEQVRTAKGHELGKTYAVRARVDLDSPAAGTIQVTRAGMAVTGTGTDFRSLFTCKEEEYLIVYQRRADGTVGRSLYGVAGCPTATALKLSRPYEDISGDGVQFQRWDAATGRRWTEGINYYDSVLVQYQNWYRTGLDDYLDYARTLADAWWRGTLLDSGRQGISTTVMPRRSGYEGLMLRALDGRPDFWPWLKGYLDNITEVWLNRLTSASGAYGVGARESGYTYLFAAVYANTVDDPAERERYIKVLTDRGRDFWHDYQCKPDNPANRCQGPLGAFRWPDPDFYGGNAEVPFHTAIAMEGVIKAHRLTNNPMLLTILERFLENNMNGKSGKKAIYSLEPSFKQDLRCRAMQYWAYADPGTATTADGVNIGGATCGSPDELRNNRTLNHEFPNIYGYLYSLNPRPEVLERGDDIFSAAFAKNDGPGADGYYGYFDSGVSDHGKQYGQGFRSSGAYLAYRLNSNLTPDSQTVALNLKSTPARIRLTAPTGVVQKVVCEKDPCLVAINARIGSYTARVEYMDAENKVQSTKTMMVSAKPRGTVRKTAGNRVAVAAGVHAWRPGEDHPWSLGPWPRIWKLTYETPLWTKAAAGAVGAGTVSLGGWMWYRRRGLE